MLGSLQPLFADAIWRRGAFRTVEPGQPEFKLRSGRTSPLYLDIRQPPLATEDIVLAGQCLAEAAHWHMLLSNWEVDYIAGVPCAGNPLAAAFANSVGRLGSLLELIKTDDDNSPVVASHYDSGQSVLLIENVVTTGLSTLRYAKRVERAGLRIAGVYTLVNRQPSEQQAIESAGYRFQSVMTAHDLVCYYVDRKSWLTWEQGDRICAHLNE